eukprot:TRINITY_DN47499_c0_g1_i1.p1 TRINITY_DN47499_c0_g1~~TRINITY_DN47499_c0_g1_i1.p1  ORF type:complete len:249 (-),score=32.59 TRINITY_DN47499_c0_g1_i1:40-786(-)
MLGSISKRGLRLIQNIHPSTSRLQAVNMSSDQSVPAEAMREMKNKLRKEIRSQLRAMTNNEASSQSHKVWERLFALEEYQNAKSVGLFLSMPTGEIKTDEALGHAMDNGKQVYIPEVGKDFELCNMDLILVPPSSSSEPNQEIFHAAWPRNKWGIPEPPESMVRQAAAPGDIDVLVVPGLAFDRAGGRLGQGKGYYDRFIERMRKDSPKPLLVAVGMQPQLIDEVPVAPYDYLIDVLVLPDETIKFSR